MNLSKIKILILIIICFSCNKKLNNKNPNIEIVDKLENLMEKAHTKAAIEKFNIPILD